MDVLPCQGVRLLVPRPQSGGALGLVVKDLWRTAIWCPGHVWGPLTLWGSEIASRRVVAVEKAACGADFVRGSKMSCFGVHVQGSLGAHGGAAASVRGAGASVGRAWRPGAWPGRAEPSPRRRPQTRRAFASPFCPVAPSLQL